MHLNTFLHALLPRDDRFYRYFEQDAENLLLGSRVLVEVMTNGISRDERMQKIKKIEELEHKGDEITHHIYSELSATFITPFDREDIHVLASKIDDVLDYIKGAATRIELYRVKKIPPDAEKMAQLIHAQVVELHKAVGLLHDLKNAPAIKESLVRINSIENEADDLFERAIAELFDTCDDPIKLIKSKELFVSLETATDQCEDASNVIETIIVKNA
jgi:predicted phosphate transport protein (TIGR00153 family)